MTLNSFTLAATANSLIKLEYLLKGTMGLKGYLASPKAVLITNCLEALLKQEKSFEGQKNNRRPNPNRPITPKF